MIAILLLLSALPAAALSNAVNFVATGALTNYPSSQRYHFREGEFPAGTFPMPVVVSGAGTIGAWQTDRCSWWPADGSVEYCTVSFQFSIAGAGTASIEFRPQANACSSGDRAACDAAGLSKAAMLAFSGGTWTASITATAYPQGSTTARTFDARAAFNADRYTYTHRGPAVTQVAVEDLTPTRADDFGWRERRLAMFTGFMQDANATQVQVDDASTWAGLSRPFEIAVGAGVNDGYERMMVCFVSGNTLYIGNSNGTDASCANTNGRNIGGTSHTYHTVRTHGTYVFLRDGARIITADPIADTNNNIFTIGIDDASAITSVTVLQAGIERFRICNKSGNTLTYGLDAWPCAVGNLRGRGWQGTSVAVSNSTPVFGINVPFYAVDPSDRWVDAPNDIYKSIHPAATLTFPTGWAGVGVRFDLAVGCDTDRMQDQWLSLSGPNSYSKAGVKAVARTHLLIPADIREHLWQGSAPSGLREQHNMAYLFQAGLVPNDPSAAVTSPTIGGYLSSTYPSSTGAVPAWNSGNNTQCEPDTLAYLESIYFLFAGADTRIVNDTGARHSIGLMHQAETLRQYSWQYGDSNSDAIRGMADRMPACQALMPYHYREHNNSRAFCDGGGYGQNTTDKACSGANLTATTFGRPPSIIAYNQITPNNQNTVNDVPSKRYPVGATTSNNWIITIPGTFSHNPALAYWAAMWKGDYFADRITVNQAFKAMAQQNAYAAADLNDNGPGRTQQRGQWAILMPDDGMRGVAWGYRDGAMGWKLADYGSPEKQVAAWWLKRGSTMWEGRYNLTGGANYIPCPADVDTTRNYTYSPWCWARKFPGFDSPTTGFPEMPGYGYEPVGNVLRVYKLHSPWMGAGYFSVSLAFMTRAGASDWEYFRRQYVGGNFVRNTVHPLARPYSLTKYQLPAMTCQPEGVDVPGGCPGTNTIGREQGFSVYANYIAAMTSDMSDLTTAAPSGGTDLDSEGYAQYALSAARSTPSINWTESGVGTLSGRRAWQFWESGIRYKDVHTANPHWIMGVLERPAPTVTVGDTTARIQDTTVYGACLIGTTTGTYFTSPDDSGDAAMSMNGQRVDHVLTGLTAATMYRARMTCGGVRTYFSFTTTAAAGGATTVTLQTAPRAGQSVATLVVDYGATEALGSQTSAACLSACTVSLPGLAGRPLYFRYTWKDGAAATVLIGKIQRYLP